MREEIKKNTTDKCQEMWELFLKTTSEGIAIFDKDMRLVLLNNAATKILGTTEKDIGKTMLEITPTLKKSDRYKKYLEVLKTGKPQLLEDVLLEQEFGKVLLSVNCFKVGDGLGIIYTDITEKTLKREQMKHLNLVLRAIRNVNQLITQEKDRRKLIKGACQALTEADGYHSVWIALIDESKDLVMVEESGLDEKFLPLKKKLKSGKSISCVQKALKQSGVQKIENPKSSCTRCPLSEDYKNRGGVAVRLEHEGKVFGIICASTNLKFLNNKEELELFAEVASDISFALFSIDMEKEREKAVKKLARSRNEILTTLNSIGDAVISTDSKGNVAFMNPIAEDLTGWKESESVGKKIKEIFHIVNEETGAEVENPVAKVIKEGAIVGLANHTILIAKNGSRIPIDDSGAPIKDEDGNIFGVVLVFRDITERKKTDEILRESERKKTIRNRIANIFLLVSEEEEMYNEVLNVLLDAMNSEYGVFGFIDENDALVIPSMTRHIWDKCQVPDKRIIFPRDTWGEGSWCRAIRAKKTIYKNEPSTITPKGHITINRHIDMPIIHLGEVIGLFQVANKPTDYNEEDIQTLSDIANHVAPILNSILKRNIEEQERKKMEEVLRESERKLSIGNRIADIFLSESEIEEKYDEVLKVLLDVMDSEYGVFGFIDENDAFVVPSMTRHIWDKCQVQDKRFIFPRDTWGEGSWCRAIREKKTIYENKPSTLTPKGHITINRHISMPLIYLGEVIGLIQIANKAIDYNEEDIQTLSDIANHIAPTLKAILQRNIEEQERKKTEEVLKESEARFRGIFESKMIGTIFWDANGNITNSNDIFLQMVGYSKDEILSGVVRWRDMTPPEYKDLDDKALEEIAATGVMTPIEKEYIRKDGTRIPILLGAASLHGPSFSGVAFVLDITKRKKAEEKLKDYSENLEEMVVKRTKELNDANEQLVRKEKLAVLGRLSGAIGHELRNPLGAIKNVAYFLNMVLEDVDPDVKESLEILEKEVNRSEKIITNILSFARPKPLVSRSTNLNDVIKEALTNIILPENIKLMSKLEESFPKIRADPDLLAHVFRNIILNGIQAMPEGGKLTIETSSAEQDWVSISIADTGSGITDDVLEKIFEPLFTTKAKGIGLGLAITKDIVEKHGGSVEIHSKVGKGTTFIIKLPVASKV